ncbi:hypothetical protein KW848_13990 [Pseudomonas sp. PDM25]|nr:hypothetical protein [Pseudomonas sp. PDM25]
MNDLKIAASNSTRDCFRNSRAIVALDQTDFTDVAGAVFSRDDLLAGALETIKRTGFDIPIFLVTSQEGGNRALDIYKQLQDVLLQVNDVFDLSRNNVEYYGHPLETAAKSYEDTLLPPFFNTLTQFFDFFAETLFRADLCNADKTSFALNGTSASNKVAAYVLKT